MNVYFIGTYPYSGELYHHGIPDQKWGVRRFVDENGSLTELGKQRLKERRSISYTTTNKAKSKSSSKTTSSNSSNGILRVNENRTALIRDALKKFREQNTVVTKKNVSQPKKQEQDQNPNKKKKKQKKKPAALKSTAKKTTPKKKVTSGKKTVKRYSGVRTKDITFAGNSASSKNAVNFLEKYGL